jgi:small subunit ribosomal protein S3Ae
MAKEKWKGKEWYQILAPKMFGEAVIGETLSIEPSQLKGRIVEVSLIELIGDPNKYYIKLFFKVSEIDSNKAYTIFFGHDCTRDFLARIVQPRTTRIDTNEIVKFEDGKIRIKSVAISNRQVNNEIERKVRKMLNELIAKEAEKMKIEAFVKSLIRGDIQQKIRKSMSKLYPLRWFEFRKTEIIA